jgi:PAS domain S-box-containing protein
LRWVVALIGVAAAAGLRFALDPVLGSAHAFPLFLGAVIVAAWFGGALPAIAAALAGYLVADYFFIEPRGFFAPRNAEALAGLGVYVVSSALIAGLGGAMHAARRRAESSEERSRAEVTKQARAAEELRSQREELRLVADTMPAGVVRISADLRYVWVNRVFASWVGRPAEDIIGQPIVEVIDERDWRELRPHVERALAGERVEYECLARFARLGERWISSTAEATRDEAGTPNGLVAVITDIHDRKLIEQTLREAEGRKDEFLATLAHELRNPLAPIRNAVAILGKKHGLDPELTWSREVIERQVEQMSRLIDDLLDIARIAGGKLRIRKERVPLERAIDMALETSRPYLNAAGHRLSVLLPSERVTVEADPARLAQVFSNLLNNAARYTEGQGEITLAAEVAGGEVVVSVQDNGIGFPPEVAGRLFEPFSQLTRSIERTHGGLGIGLSLVQGIVALHGGKVEARSRGLGEGAEFIVRLPLPRHTDAADARPPVQARERAPAGGVKILVADDNRDAADSLQRILSLYGYHVEVAYDGAAAILLDGAFRPRVAVLDIGMPGANGFEVARSIRGTRGEDVTLIALTGWGQEGDRRRAMEAGFDYHLTKPVDPGALNDLLVEVATK